MDDMKYYPALSFKLWGGLKTDRIQFRILVLIFSGGFYHCSKSFSGYSQNMQLIPFEFWCKLNSILTEYIYRIYLGTHSKKITGLFGNFSHIGGGGLPNSQNFCKLTKYFFVCQIHSEVLKHVLQRGRWWYLINFIT